MKISKNKRGGLEISGKGDLLLSRDEKIWLKIDTDNNDITHWNVIMNCKNNKDEALLKIIKWLYNLK